MSANQGETYYIINISDWNSLFGENGILEGSPYQDIFGTLFGDEEPFESPLVPGCYLIPLDQISDLEAEFLRGGDVEYGGSFVGFASFGQYTYTLSTQPIGG